MTLPFHIIGRLFVKYIVLWRKINDPSELSSINRWLYARKFNKMVKGFLQSLSRKKTIIEDVGSKLSRCLTLVDLSALGVGSTLGLGVYVLAGSVAKNLAGPAVTISFLVAAIASAVAGFCYAEFAARVPRAGSAYVYSYVSVGEFIAFIIGWNLILEYVIGTASVASGLSKYIDALTNKTIEAYFIEKMPMDIGFLANYPDFVSFIFVLILTALLSSGVKESTLLNNIFTALNLATVLVVLVAGSIKADPANWALRKDQIPASAGEGGFAPFGIKGIMAGAAKCFYGFVGFDAVATTGEEAINPQRNIPLAVVISLVIIFLSYFGISTVLTMMWPYYLQDEDAPFPYVFDSIGWPTIKWIVTVGAVFALCTSLLGAMFPLPRVIYAMSSDGLIFRWLSSVNPRTKTPVIATVVSGVFAGIMSTIFNLQQLIDMMSIGTLLAYTIVAICILILRYKPADNASYPEIEKCPEELNPVTYFSMVRDIFNLNMSKYPSDTTYMITNWSTGLFCIFSGVFCGLITNAIDWLTPEEPMYFVPFIIAIFLMLTLLFIIYRQPVSDAKLAFKVPWVPLLPCASIIMNLYLMFELDKETWIRFIVWLVIGFLIYFFYGMKNSEEKRIRAKLNNDRKPSSVTTTSMRSQKIIEADEKKDNYRQVTEF